MMPLHSVVVLALFTILGLAMIGLIIYGGIHQMKFWGIPSIHPFFFITAKIAFAICLALFLTKALVPELGYFHPPLWMSWCGTGLLFLSAIFFIRAFIDLGPSLLVGLPEKETKLRTMGIYRISRNPIYLAVYLFCAGSCLYFPEPGNIAVAFYAIYFHHRIVLSEEKFLETRFGEEWREYCKRVRRYL
jgi:protein-S-isoprenylcysteine O-methyltransferase Ste14